MVAVFEILNLLVINHLKEISLSFYYYYIYIHVYVCILGDHYSELSVLGCKYRFYPDHPFKRRLIRGSILCGKILAAPIVLCLAVVAGAVCAGVGLPAYCCLMLVRHVKVRRRKRNSF